MLFPPDKNHPTKTPTLLFLDTCGPYPARHSAVPVPPRDVPQAAAVRALSINSQPVQGRCALHPSRGALLRAQIRSVSISWSCYQPFKRQHLNSSRCHPPGWEPPASADLTSHEKQAQEARFFIGVSTNPVSALRVERATWPQGAVWRGQYNPLTN